MDADRRQLEREANRDPSRGARLLLERVRAGELSPDDLRLAAWVGDADARAAAPDVVPPDALRPWALGVGAWGQQAFVRLLVAALRPAVAGHDDLTSRAAAEVLVDALEDWTRRPDEETRLRVRELAETRLAPTLGQTVAQRGNPSYWEILGAAQLAARNLIRADWVAEAVIPTTLPAGTEPEQLNAVAGHLAEQGAVVAWHDAGRGRLELRVQDCGLIGAGGLTKAMQPLSPLEPLDLLERLRPVRERAAPVVYAAKRAGEEQVRRSIREALAPWALRARSPDDR